MQHELQQWAAYAGWLALLMLQGECCMHASQCEHDVAGVIAHDAPQWVCCPCSLQDALNPL